MFKDFMAGESFQMKKILLLIFFLAIGANSLFALDFKITKITGSVLFTNYTSKITLWYNCDERVTLSTAVYLSEDTIYSNDDNLIFSERKIYEKSTSSGWILNINGIGNAAGKYIIVRVNGEQSISEVNYRNNTIAIPVTIHEATYDVSVYQINGPSRVIIGNELSLVPYLKNLGDIDYAYDMSFYLSKDTIHDESDISLGNYVSSSPIKSEDYRYAYIKAATDTLKGKYYVLAIADPENKVDEVNEENNLFYKAVDFVEENFEQKAYSIENVSEYNSAGGIIEFSFYHSNIGTTVPTNNSNSIFTTAFYISLDSVFSSEDRLIGSKKGSVTSPGSRGAVVVSKTDGFVIPDSYMDTDSVYLICILDSEGTLVSNDRSNDTIFTKVYLNPPIAIVDVRVNNFNPHFWSNNISQGVSYNYHNSGVLFQFKSAFTPGLNVMNSGTLPASGVHVAMYLSEDTTLSNDDILIKKVDLGTIGAREGKNPTLSIDLSALDIAEGNYYFFYVENPDKLYDDLAIDNDTFYYPFCYKAAPLVDYFFEYSEVGPVEVEPGDTLSLRFYEMSNLYGYRSSDTKVFFSKDSVYDALDIEADYGGDIILPDDWSEDHVFVIISLNHDRFEPEEYYFNNFSIHKLSVNNPVITSMKEQVGELIAKIYPTIAKNVVNIDLNTNGEANVVVRNTYGALLLDKKFNDATILDIANFASGIYFIDILQGNTKYCWKIIKE
jgi:hypothetical protein